MLHTFELFKNHHLNIHLYSKIENLDQVKNLAKEKEIYITFLNPITVTHNPKTHSFKDNDHQINFTCL